MESSRLQIFRFNAEYLVSDQHPSPGRVKDRLDEAITRHLSPALSRAFSGWFSETDPSIWLIRHLEFEVAVDAALEPDQLGRVFTRQMARTLGSMLQEGTDPDNVIRFPNRAAYVARFLSDLSVGVASTRWYYRSFEGLRMLPASAALRTAICDDPDIGRDALLQLTDEELRQVAGSLTTLDTRYVLDRLTERFEGTGDDFESCKAVWAAWQSIRETLVDRHDIWKPALQLSVAAGRQDKRARGLGHTRAAIALLRLRHRLTGGSIEQRDDLISVLTGGDIGGLYRNTGASDGEMLAPLLGCPPEWVREVAETMMTADPAPSIRDTETPGPRATRFGGAFLLLPLLDELPLAEATGGWPHADEAAAITLVRFLLLIKCCGQEHADRLFYDPLVRDLLLIPPAISQAELTRWQSEIRTDHLESFLEALLRWQETRGTIAGKKQIVTSIALNNRQFVVLIDAERGIWLSLQRHFRSRPQRLIEALRSELSKLSNEDGLLLCESSLLPLLWPEFPALKIISIEDGTSADLIADEQLSGIMARLDKLPAEFSHLALPGSLKLSRALDSTLSIAAQHLLRAFAWRLPGFAGSNLPYLWRNFLDFRGSLEDEPARRVVRLGRPPLNLVMGMTGMTRQSYSLSWLDERPFALFQTD